MAGRMKTESVGRGVSMATYLRRLVWLAILPLLLLAVGMAADAWRRQRAADERAGQLLATQLSQQIEEVVRRRRDGLEVLADSPLLDENRLADFHRRAQVFPRRIGGDLILADGQGHMLLHTGVPYGEPLPPLPRPQGGAAVPLALASGRAAVGDRFVGAISKRPLVAIAVPVLRNGKAEQVLLSTIEVQLFQEQIARVGIPEGWHVTLLDSGQQLLAGGFAAGSSASEPESGGMRYTQTLETAPWTVVVDESAASRRGPLLATLAAFAVAIAFATLLGRLGSGLGGHRLAYAVGQLARRGPTQPGDVPITEIEAARATIAAADADRDAALQALQRSRAQLAALVEQAPHSIALFDRDMTCLASSARWNHQFVPGRRSVIGQNHYVLIPDQPPEWKAVHERGLAGESLSSEADRWLRADGSEQWLSWVVQPWTDDDGAVAGLIISSEDVAEQRRMVQALREASERFSTLFESAPVAMAVGDMEHMRLVEVNAAFESLSGYLRAEVLGRTSTEFDLWVDWASRNEAVRQLNEQGALSAQEARLRRRDGSIIDVSYSSCRVEIAGRPHFLAMIVDTTPLQQARRVLERQQEELEALVARRTVELQAANQTLAERADAITELYDGAPCGYHALSPDGTIIAVNATELRMLGYAHDEFVGQPLTHFLTSESQALFRKHFARFRVTGSVRDVELDMIRKDGSTLPVLVNAVLVRDAEGRHTSGRAVVFDNSERKARERQIQAMQQELARRADEAEAANRAKSAFLANMSHEIRTPMNAIIGLTYLLARDTSEPLQRGRLGKVESAAKHLLSVINDILDLSKIEAGKMVLEDTEFSLDELVAKAFSMVEGPARAKGLELIIDTDHSPALLRGDPTRLSQALVNLLANAVKFTGSGWVKNLQYRMIIYHYNQ